MSLFNPAFAYLMQWEDSSFSYSEAVDNNGGGVIAGINSKSFPDDYERIKAIPQAERGTPVASFYQMHFWIPMRLGEITSQDVANRVLDMGVNSGPSTSIRMLQEAVYALPCHVNIATDGKIGPATLAAVNECDPYELLEAWKSLRKQFYQHLVEKKPDNAKYLAGWLKRAGA